MWDSVKFWIAKEVASLLWFLLVVGGLVLAVVIYAIGEWVVAKFKRGAR